MILLYLPTRDLILLQTTSKIWRATIQNCKSLRIKLYRQPSTRPAVAWIQDARSTPPDLSSLFPFHRTIAKQIDRLGTVTDVKPNEDFAVAASFNDLIIQPMQPTHLTVRIACGESAFVRDNVREYIFQHENPLSCDDMYLTDPPAMALHILWDCKAECSDPLLTYHFAEVTNLAGMTVGDLRKAVREECSKNCCLGSDMEIDFKRPRQLDGEWSTGLLFPTEADYEEARRVDRRDTSLVSGHS